MRQKYDNFNLFPVRCWNFQASDALVSDTLDKVMKLDYRKYNPDGGVGTSNDTVSYTHLTLPTILLV